MAGRRQHYIPRMLLRGFADEREQVRVTHRSHGGFLTSIGNVALERDFFGAPGPGTVDEAVTIEENKIKAILKAISVTTGAVDSERAATLISHMTSRVLGIRTYMEEMGKIMFAEVDQRLQDETSTREALLRELRRDPTSVGKELDDALQSQYGKTAFKQFKRTPAYKKMLASARVQVEAHIMSAQFTEITDRFRDVLAKISSDMRGAVVRAHGKSLLASPTPAPKVETLSALSYETVERDGIILSDSVAWCIRKGGQLAPVFSLEDDIDSIYMPVCSSLVLVGRCQGSKAEVPTAAELQRAAFRVSEDFVVAHPSAKVDGDLVAQFGTSSKESIQKVADDIRSTEW